MKIKISRGIVVETGDMYILVDFYKTEEAYYNPSDHEDEIWHCYCEFDANDPTKTCELSLVDRLINILENSVNSCLEKALK